MVQVVLSDDDVVSTNPKLTFVPSNTCKCGELKEALEKAAGVNLHSFVEGSPCEVLRSSGGGWQKGKVYLSVVFVPDEPEQNPLE